MKLTKEEDETELEINDSRKVGKTPTEGEAGTSDDDKGHKCHQTEKVSNFHYISFRIYHSCLNTCFLRTSLKNWHDRTQVLPD